MWLQIAAAANRSSKEYHINFGQWSCMRSYARILALANFRFFFNISADVLKLVFE